MKFKAYVESLNKLLEDRPEVAEFDVVTSKDDEGNGYQLVENPPSLFSVLDIDVRHLEPDIEMLKRAGEGVDTKSEDFKRLNCIIVN